MPLALRLPEFYQTLPGVTLPLWLVMYPISIIALTVMLTKLWKWTGSVLIAIIFHDAVNFTLAKLVGDLQAAPYRPVNAFALLNALFWIAAGVFVGIDRWVVQRRRSPQPAANQAKIG